MRKPVVLLSLLSLLLSTLVFVPVSSAQEALRVDAPLADAQLVPTDHHPRPFPMGISISTTPSLPFTFAGTAGLRVRSLADPNRRFILSNNHVLGAVGPLLCPNSSPPGTWALQPGTLDIGFDPGMDPAFFAGVVVGMVPIDFTPGASNLVDAALAITTPSFASNEIFNIGDPTVDFALPSPGDPVTKSGRTTGVTIGTVDSVNTTAVVNYGATCGAARFVRQVVITPGSFSTGGDSGSAILDSDTLIPVGLLFAGSAASTIANPMWAVYLSTGTFVDGAASAPTSFEDMIRRMTARDNEPQMRRLRAIQARSENAILGVPGVGGIGIGRTADGSGPAFIVYCVRRTAAVLTRVPSQLEGVPVRIVESGEFRAF